MGHEMTTQTEALKLALEALETYHGYMEPLLTVFGGPRVPAEKSTTYKVEKAITAIKEALAQQSNEQVEPVGLVSRAAHMDVIVVNLIREGINKHRARDLADHFLKYTHPPVPTAQPCDCTRSHPHEEMSKECELRTEIARLTNELARLKAQPKEPEQNLKLMPREATQEMLKAMDECSKDGYDERLYAGHAGSVYMAAWDAFTHPPVPMAQPKEPEQKPVADPFADIHDKRIGEMTAEQKDRAIELWLRNQKGWLPMSQREHVEALLRVIDGLRTTPPQRKPCTFCGSTGHKETCDSVGAIISKTTGCPMHDGIKE